MPMSAAYKAATSDIITGYCFGVSTGFLMRDDYNIPFLDSVAANFGLAWWMTHIAWLGPLLNSIPTFIKSVLMPGLESLFQMQRVNSQDCFSKSYSDMRQQWIRQIDGIRASKHLETNDETIFHGILNSDLPPSEKKTSRLRQEAQLLVQAGQDTTGTAPVIDECYG